MDELSRQKLTQLLYDFHNLTGIKICLYDSARNELCFYPEKLSPFCRLLREDREMAARCAECDRQAFAACTKTRSRHAYTCHAGLLECFSPIVYREKIIGFIVVGQIKAAEGQPFDRVADRLPPSMSRRLKQEYDKLPALAPGTIDSAIRILDACAGYEYLKALDSSETPIDARIAAHIEKNLTDDLSVTTLCRVFHVSRNELYSIFRERFDSSVADFVRARRLCSARTMLETQDTAVADIAVRCGLPDYNYFSKLFKAAFGLSPSAYRKRSRIDQEKTPLA